MNVPEEVDERKTRKIGIFTFHTLAGKKIMLSRLLANLQNVNHSFQLFITALVPPFQSLVPYRPVFSEVSELW